MVFEHIYDEKTRNSMFSAKKKELRNMLGLPVSKAEEKESDSRLRLATNLADQAAFLMISLDELNKTLIRDGFVETYTNGEHQSGQKKSVASELVERYDKELVIMTKQLTDMLPDNGSGDELKKFINSGPGIRHG